MDEQFEIPQHSPSKDNTIEADTQLNHTQNQVAAEHNINIETDQVVMVKRAEEDNFSKTNLTVTFTDQTITPD